MLPDTLITPTGDRSTTVEALAIVLNRLVYPTRYTSQIHLFGRSAPALCRIFLCAIDHIYERWHLILYCHLPLLAARMVSQHLIDPFKGNNLSEQQQQFNAAMSSVRESVKWTFGKMKALWACIDFSKKHKVMLSPAGKIVQVAMLMTNSHCCYYRGNQVSAYFGVDPPT
ncbi:TPA: hypothetical protein N0F65_011428 [Lagenidium giganteum]|uniref:DDE Tnp4 domain-containing protein n=1 Tax=Lagenidium giganteum TaxID=4803 RepID=A0AAV2ZD84_9STRA|nr:TPA: hypothetical protein N0F65_011428 [Lagenidium giganteum]